MYIQCGIIVLLGKKLPQVVVPGPDVSVLQHDDNITLTCNLTERGHFLNSLKRISWFKDSVVLESVRNPDPQNSNDALGPLKLKSVSVRDGGKYTCLLEVLLRRSKEYNVSDDTMIHSKHNVQYTCLTWFALNGTGLVLVLVPASVTLGNISCNLSRNFLAPL